MYQVVVWVHVVAACIWVGGILFFALVLVPALRRGPGLRGNELVQAVGRRFRVVGWWSVVVLVLTGIANVLYRVPSSQLWAAEFWQSTWGRTLALKLVLVGVMLAVSVAHDVMGARAVRGGAVDVGAADVHRSRVLASRLGRALGVLVLATVFVAVTLVRGW